MSSGPGAITSAWQSVRGVGLESSGPDGIRLPKVSREGTRGEIYDMFARIADNASSKKNMRRAAAGAFLPCGSGCFCFFAATFSAAPF